MEGQRTKNPIENNRKGICTCNSDEHDPQAFDNVYSSSVIIRKMQNETLLICHFSPTRK